MNQAIVGCTEAELNQAIVGCTEAELNQAKVATKLTKVATELPIYAGRDIHAYTNQVNRAAVKYMDMFAGQLDSVAFETILSEMIAAYGSKNTFVNLRNVFKNGYITDPDVPIINVAILLQKVWNQVKESEQNIARNPPTSTSFKVHFNQTLDDIGMTCIQGISHRLLIDFVAFCTDC